MAHNVKPPARCNTLAAREVDRPRGLIYTEINASHLERQTRRIADRFRLPLPTAATVARLAFDSAVPR